MGLNRREAKSLGKLMSAGAKAASAKLDESMERQLEEAQRGDNSLVRTQRDSAAMLRRQGEKYLGEAAEAEAAGKTSKAARHRKAGERAMRQADDWDRKADATGEKAKAWAADILAKREDRAAEE